MLRVDSLSVWFQGLKALDEVTIKVDRGEIYAVIGPNGAGKTTLFNALTGFARPSSGRIYFRDEPLLGLAPERISRKGIARTFQVAKPFSGVSVLDNVIAGAVSHSSNIREARDRANDAISRVKLDGFRNHNAGSLPVALRKRLELARAVATGATFICMDEVMGGLSPHEVQEAMAIIRDLRDSGVTILIIEHNMQALMQLADRVAVLNTGAVITVGTPNEVTQDGRVIEAYLGVPHESA